MTAVSALGAVATSVAGAFALCTYERWRARGRRHELAWTQSLLMFTLASAAYWWGGATGWNQWNFRCFYLFGAILNVPFLATGTVYLLAGEEPGRRVHRILVPAAAFCAGVVLVAPLRSPLPVEGLPEGRLVFGPLPRIMAAVGSGVGATVLIGGALWSAQRLLVVGRRPARGAAPAVTPRRLALTNVLIAAGTIVLSLGGTFYSGTDAELAFGVFLVAGIIVLFAGFLVSAAGAPSRTPQPPPGLGPFGIELWAVARGEEAVRA